jgi:hypothetical protein
LSHLEAAFSTVGEFRVPKVPAAPWRWADNHAGLVMIETMAIVAGLRLFRDIPRSK